jgi:hypothetical protein
MGCESALEATTRAPVFWTNKNIVVAFNFNANNNLTTIYDFASTLKTVGASASSGEAINSSPGESMFNITALLSHWLAYSSNWDDFKIHVYSIWHTQKEQRLLHVGCP